MEFTLCETPEETVTQAPAPSLLSCLGTTDGPQSWWTKLVSQFWAFSAYMWRSCTTKLHPLEQPLAALNLNSPLSSTASALSSLPPRCSVCTCRHIRSESRTWLSLSPEPRMPPPFPQTCASNDSLMTLKQKFYCLPPNSFVYCHF